MGKKNQNKVAKIVTTVVGCLAYVILFAAAVVLTVFFGIRAFGADPLFAVAEDAAPFVKFLAAQGVPGIVGTVQIVTVAILFGVILTLLEKVRFISQKLTTIFLLVVNFLKWVVAIVTLLAILDAWKINPIVGVAIAGVVTLIIGLGSQALVSDILAGIFIVFEGDFQCGDIVIVDGWRGEVKAIGVRTTKLVDAGGNIKIINNSDIRSIVNQTQELSVAKCYVGISYGDRIEAVEKVIDDNLAKIKEKIPAIVEGPFYKGVTELGDSAVNLLFVAKCKEADIYQVQRDMNREIKIVFDDNNVNIPFPQVTVSYDQGSDTTKIATSVKSQAEHFVEEQKDLSKDIDIKKQPLNYIHYRSLIIEAPFH